MDIEDLHLLFQNHKSIDFHDFHTEIHQLQHNMLDWYDSNRRSLPWRGDKPPFNTTVSISQNSDPDLIEQEIENFPKSAYGTWVSEIMLQQTKVETVVNYFLKWMKKFPDVQTLANASAEEVNSLWAGLGYYRRARMLHEGANYVQTELNGVIPDEVEELIKIPGIGAYTAGAVSSIAFNRVEPLVDGNVIRVLSRLRAIQASPKNPNLVKLCWKLVRQIIDQNRPGDFNQALMELGATVCTPQNPQCTRCPVQGLCMSYKLVSIRKETEEKEERKENKVVKKKQKKSDDSKQQECCKVCELEEGGKKIPLPTEVTNFPLKVVKKQQREDILAVGIFEWFHPQTNQSYFLMLKRPSEGLLANQWEFPNIEMTKDNCDGEELLQDFIVTELPENAHVAQQKFKFYEKVTHIFTHVKFLMHVWYMKIVSDESIFSAINVPFYTIKGTQEALWLSENTMQEMGITTCFKKVLKHVQKQSQKNAESKKILDFFQPKSVPTKKRKLQEISKAPPKKRVK